MRHLTAVLNHETTESADGQTRYGVVSLVDDDANQADVIGLAPTGTTWTVNEIEKHIATELDGEEVKIEFDYIDGITDEDGDDTRSLAD